MSPGAPRHHQRSIELVRACSVELSPRDSAGDLHQLFESDTTVFVNHPPSITCADVIAASASFSRAGFAVVPHVVARRLASFSEASGFLHALAEDAGVTQVLLLGGDTSPPLGPFHDALSLLATGLLERYRIKSVAFAGYPEGHPRIDAIALQAALQAKLALARRRGLATSVVTQFGFEAVPIQRWIAGLRAAGIDCPIRVGLAGPATVATLAKYAIRCGIGASLRALTHGHTAIARILSEADPSALIESLAVSENPARPIDGLHIFCFGGAQRTAEWRRRFLAR